MDCKRCGTWNPGKPISNKCYNCGWELEDMEMPEPPKKVVVG